MIKLIGDFLAAFGAIVVRLLGIGKKKSTRNKNVVRKPGRAVQNAKPAARIPDRVIQKAESSAQSKNVAPNTGYDVWKVKILAPQRTTPQPAAKTVSKPSIEIDPKAFFHWAGNDLDRWKLLIGAAIRHTYFGKGIIKKVSRADEHSGVIHLSIATNNDQRNITFVVSNFNNSDKPFYELLVDSGCYEKFQNEKTLESPKDTSQWKHDWNEYEKIINHYQIESLYHFTDSANIPSIIKHGGLYSWWSCQQKGIAIPKPGANDLSRKLDHHKDLHDYVHLSFNNNHPMLAQAKHEGRIENLVILKISSEVICWKAALFSDLNATANGAQIGGNIADLKKVRFEIVFQPYYDEHTKPFYQAEVLVRTHIPIKYILSMN